MSKWLTWDPSHRHTVGNPPGSEPANPTEPNFAGFAGLVHKENPIIRGPQPAPAKCPYPLPQGVKLIRYTPKNSPVAVTVCSVVTQVPKFIQHALGELDARLHSPVQIKAGDSVFDLLSKLSDCGVELRLLWPPETQMMDNPAEREPSKPTKPQESNADNPEITDEDIPF